MYRKDVRNFFSIHPALLLVICCLVVLIVALSVKIINTYSLEKDPVLVEKATTEIPHVTDTENFIEYLHKNLETLGSDVLQEQLKDLYANAEGGEQHMAFHYFGEVLYKTMGPVSLPLCENWYGFGCYHGFLLDVIGTEGYEVVPSLDKACRDINGYSMDTETCQHGIGHGLLEFSGRDPVKAIAGCDLVNDVYKKLGCASGVFMEYFSPTQSAERVVRSQLPIFDENDPFATCRSFTGIRFATCLFEIHGWWEDTLRMTPRAVEAACSSVEDQDAREFCFIGYGNFKGPYVANAAPYCDQFNSEGNNALCRAGILWAAEHHNDSPNPQSACSDLKGEYQALCFEKGRFTCEVEGNCREE